MEQDNLVDNAAKMGERLLEGLQVAVGKRPNPFIDARGYRRFINLTEVAFRAELKRQRG